MNRRDLPDECADMPRGLVMRHLGIDPTERSTSGSGDLAAAITSLQAQLDTERGAA